MMNKRPLPSDIIDRFGHLPDATHRTGDEFSSSCPQCGGGRGGNDLSDSFRMWERQGQASSFWCRRCGYQGFTDDNQPNQKPDPARILELEEIRQREATKEEQRLKNLICDLREKAYWQGWHDAMGESQRQLWRNEGIHDEFQAYWQLGYKAEYRGRGFVSPAMTIPHFNDEWEALTIQYRLLSPPTPSDKYRFQAGLHSALWQADPSTEIKNSVIVCEGMKKAAVTFIELVARGNGRFCIVSVPSKMPSQELIDVLNNADPLYIVLDPDAFTGRKPAINRFAKMVAAPKRIVKLPVKADDFFTLHGGMPIDFINYLNVGKPV